MAGNLVMQPSSDLEMILSENDRLKITEGISKKISDWQEAMGNFFIEWEEYATAYRLIETVGSTWNGIVSSQGSPNLSTKTRVGEMLRSTEALTTAIFRMMTSADPPYDVISRDASQSQEQIYAVWLQLRYQDRMTKWKRNLLRATRGLCLFGTQFVEKPWISHYSGGKLLWEGLGFRPRSLIQTAFDPNILNIDETPHICFLDYFTKPQLEALAEEDPDNWNPDQVKKAIEMEGGKPKYSPTLEIRRTKAGYKETPKFEVATYYGPIKDLSREDGRLWRLRIINEKTVVSAGPNPAPNGELPFEAATFINFELEPLGMGVGRLGRIAQRHMDENRRRTMDIARMSLMNMWLRSRTSGINKSDLKIRPLGVVDTDEMEGLKALIPNLTGADLGMKMEEIFKEEMQGNTGAVAGLQASTTDASATEASIAQNEGIRRISVIAEDIAESFVRDYQESKHAYNMAWLESDLWLSVSGSDKPIRVNRNTMAPDVSIAAKVTTDKDFRPKRIDNLIKVHQILTSIRTRPNILVDETEIVKELVVALDVNPKLIFRDVNNIAPNTALNFMMQAKQNAANARQEMGGDMVDGETTGNTKSVPIYGGAVQGSPQ